MHEGQGGDTGFCETDGFAEETGWFRGGSCVYGGEWVSCGETERFAGRCVQVCGPYKSESRRDSARLPLAASRGWGRVR